MQVTIYIGHNINDIPTLDTNTVLNEVMNTIHPEAFTTWEAAGYWNGTPEITTIIQLNGQDPDSLPTLEQQISIAAHNLKQYSIWFEVIEEHTAKEIKQLNNEIEMRA